MTQFPPLRMAVLSGLIDLKPNLDHLDDPTCPYDEETKATLRKLLAPEIKEVIVEKEGAAPKAERGRPSKEVNLTAEDREFLNVEIKKAVEEINALGTGEGLSMQERLALTKNKTGLLDTVLKLRERNTGAKKMEEFMETVMGLLNDFMTEGDRHLFMKRLEPYR